METEAETGGGGHQPRDGRPEPPGKLEEAGEDLPGSPCRSFPALGHPGPQTSASGTREVSGPGTRMA